MLSLRESVVKLSEVQVAPDPTVVRLLARLAIGSSEDLSVAEFED